MTSPSVARDGPERYRGEIVYIYAYDIAYEIADESITSVLGQAVERYAAGPSKRARARGSSIGR